MTFDAEGDLWLASYTNSIVLEISAASLSSASPVSSMNLVSSPANPAALAFDTDGSLWVTGQYQASGASAPGILLNFATDQLTAGVNANPTYCMTTQSPPPAGCQYAPFLNPEGLALLNGDIWVANNAVDTSTAQSPGREIFDIRVVSGALVLENTYGSSTSPALSPIVCPGGLFATDTQLWVNDESYGQANPDCGSMSAGSGAAGGIFDLTASQLAALSTQAPLYTNVTGRPGFGGLFVQNGN
jgi:hypothetical protein